MTHVSPAVHEHQTLELRAERDRLRAQNAELRAALQDIDIMHGDGDAAFGRCLDIARAALAKPAA